MVEPDSVRPGIFVATPAYGAACYMPYVSGLLSLQKACTEAGIGFDYFYVSGTALLHEQRNVAAAAFMHHSDLSHLLFLDADLGFEGADIVRMFAAQQDVVLGPYPAKHINWQAVVDAARRQPDLAPHEVALYMADYSAIFYGLDGREAFVADGLNEIHAGGAGLMLLSRTALAALEEAYPAARSTLPAPYGHLVPNVDIMVEYFAFDREPDGRLLSEDLTFCKRWREIGGRIYAAPWVRATHVGPFYFRGELPLLLSANRSASSPAAGEAAPEPVVPAPVPGEGAGRVAAERGPAAGR
ncbi:hypothetical protein [Methylobacterium sp. J-076]|uniref:hypothetical protein n=1 Tax=Methylobacterium sp. J-076 TaxID=2836655 RepID=UPI001FB91046|nr:hypothetical protein [Methylobacterium sp. J-076]MCJ2013111.1 hypothetical protein [Methylobacterium sp. J-076]